MFRTLHPLPKEISGLVVYTQFQDVFQRSTSVNFPIRRVYQIEVDEEFTGKEIEAINLLRGDLKPRLISIIKDRELTLGESSKNATLTIYDYKPDKVYQMLVALRHDPKTIIRTHLGALDIGDLKPGEWKELSEHDVDNLLMKFNPKSIVLNVKDSEELGEIEELDHKKSEKAEKQIKKIIKKNKSAQ
jgi:16S rRNA U516 pseudouridylate synthase RsuA-like enzyme